MSATREDIIALMTPIAAIAIKSHISVMDLRSLAAEAHYKAMQLDPDWHGPIDGEMTDEHFDEDERR